MFGQIYDEICWSIYKFFELWKVFQDFTDTSLWSGSSWVRIQCQQKHGCGKPTHNFNCSMYHLQLHGVS